MTTLCYIEKDDSYLMMHRTVKKNDATRTSGSASAAMRNLAKARRNACCVK